MRTAFLLCTIVSAVALWGWACDSGSTGAPTRAATVTPTATMTVATGNTALDALVADLQSQNVEALLRRVEFLPVPCRANGVDDQPPPCPLGVADRTPLPAFSTGACEGQLLTSIDQLRPAFEAAFESSGRSSLYAIGRASLVKHGDLYNVAVIVPGMKPDPRAPATLWYATDAGRIVRLQFECDPLGAAQTVEAQGLGGAGFIVEPQSICQGGEIDLALEVIRTSDIGGGRPEIVGSSMRGGAHREIILVLNETILPFRPQRDPSPRVPEWSGDISRIEDVTPGMQLRIHGWQMDSCVVEAWSIALTTRG